MSKFENIDELDRHVEADDVAHAAPLLFPKDYDRPSRLQDVTANILIDEGVSKPIAVVISNRLKAEAANIPNYWSGLDLLSLENEVPFLLAGWNITGTFLLSSSLMLRCALFTLQSLNTQNSVSILSNVKKTQI